MKRFISVGAETVRFLQKAFNVTGMTVSNALKFDERRGNSERAVRIRRMALMKDGIIMNELPECETVHSADGIMRQRFGNGAVIEADMKNGGVKVFFKGDEISCTPNPTIKQFSLLQEQAAKLK